MDNILVAPFGKHIEDIFVALRDFPAKLVISINKECPGKEQSITGLKQKLSKFQINLEVVSITNNLWEDTFRVMSEIKNYYPNNNILVVSSTADRLTACAITSAGFINGLRVVAVRGSDLMLMPVMKFSYYKALTDKKMEILNFLYDNNCESSLEELSQQTKMSLPLISYHLNGNLKSEGLKDLGLIETTLNKGKTQIKLTVQGRLLIGKYIN